MGRKGGTESSRKAAVQLFLLGRVKYKEKRKREKKRKTSWFRELEKISVWDIHFPFYFNQFLALGETPLFKLALILKPRQFWLTESLGILMLALKWLWSCPPMPLLVCMDAQWAVLWAGGHGIPCAQPWPPAHQGGTAKGKQCPVGQHAPLLLPAAALKPYSLLAPVILITLQARA